MMNKLQKLFLAVCLIFHVTEKAHAQYFENIIGKEFNDRAIGVVQIPNGDFIICGETFSVSPNEILLTRIDANGNMIWQNAYGNSGGADYPKSLAVNNNGDVLVGGITSSNSFRAEGDAFLLVIDSDNGQILQDFRYSDIAVDEGRSIASMYQLANGDYLFSGYRGSVFDGNLHEGMVVRIDSNGQVIWSRDYSDISRLYISPASSGEIIASGAILGGDHRGLYLLDPSNGNLNWGLRLETNSNVSDEFGYRTIELPNGKFCILGTQGFFQSNYRDIVLQVVDPDSNLYQSYVYTNQGTPVYDAAFQFYLTSNNTLLLVGISGDITNQERDGMLMEILPNNGTVLNSRKFYLPGDNVFADGALLGNNEIVLVGTTSRLIGSQTWANQNIHIVRTAIKSPREVCNSLPIDYVKSNPQTLSNSNVNPGILNLNFYTGNFQRIPISLDNEMLCQIPAMSVSGPSEEWGATIKTYPNPMEDKLYFDLEPIGHTIEKETSIRLLDIHGKPVTALSYLKGKSKGEIDVSHIPAGVYLLEIRNSEYRIVKKLVKH